MRPLFRRLPRLSCTGLSGEYNQMPHALLKYSVQRQGDYLFLFPKSSILLYPRRNIEAAILNTFKGIKDADIEAELTTPMNLAVGLAFDPFSQLTLSLDYQYVGWSSYDVLAVNFVDATYTDLASPRDYEDTYIGRFGLEYRLSPTLSLLGGVYYDHRPVAPEKVSPSLPDANRLGFSGGFDFKVSPKIGIAASYLFIRSEETTVTDSQEDYTSGISPFNGTYNSTANLFSLSLSYSF